MVLNQKQLIEYAIKGVNADIDKIERSIRRGENLLEAKEKGIAPYSDKTPLEIKQTIQKKKAEVEHLTFTVMKLKWELSELEEKEQ